MVDTENIVQKDSEAGKSDTQVSDSAEEVETNAKNEADMEKERNEIGGVEETVQDLDSEVVVETSENVGEVDGTKHTEAEVETMAEVDEIKNTEAEEETDIGTGDEGQKGADDEEDTGQKEADETEEMNADTEADMEKEANGIGVVEEADQVVDAEEVVDTSEEVAEVDETKNNEVGEETDIRTADEGQKEVGEETDITTADEGQKEVGEETDISTADEGQKDVVDEEDMGEKNTDDKADETEETTANNETDMEKEGNVIGGVEEAVQIVDAEVVETSEKVAEVDETKDAEAEEDTDMRSGSGSQKEADNEADDTKDMGQKEAVEEAEGMCQMEADETEEMNAENDADMEKEGNEISGVEEAVQIVNAVVVETSEGVAEIGETKNTEVEEKTDVRTGDEKEADETGDTFQKEADGEAGETVEPNAKNEADMEKEGSEIGGVEDAVVDSGVVETSEKTAEVDETKNTEVGEETDARTGDEGQKEDDDEADEPEDIEIHGDSSEAVVAEGIVNDVDMEMTEAQETVVAEAGEEEPEEVEDFEEENKSTAGKRKRGRNSKPLKGLAKKKEEDVCFICFDGGDLVLCDRRGCPKAYHPSCVGRDEAFFQSKGKWNCGWHLCSKCEKTATYLCYTCTFSLCKGCVKEAVFFCVRGNKGLCETCMDTVRLIESKEQEKDEPAQLDFDDKSSWEYLFKDYWVDLKARLSLTSEELDQAKSPGKGHGTQVAKPETPNKGNYATDGGSDSDGPPKRRKSRRQSKSDALILSASDKSSSGDNVEWASKELLDVVVHMRHGDRSFLPQSEVHCLLLEYIKRYNLRDPRRKSQVICDSRLQNLFGKSHVGHFEMLNLLDSHFLIKDESHVDDIQRTAVDTEANLVDADESLDQPTKTGKDKKRKTRRKGDSRGRQSNLDDFAAIDIHNINLIYLRRSLVEDLLEDLITFQEKVVGAFVRLRISGNQKQDLYRLVQVVGTSKAAEPYKVGKKTTDFVLEILNLDKTEVVSIDIISNQDFTEDECKRLRQSIKCGFINRLTVGGIQEKAIALQEVRVKNLLEGETVRLSHLRDRASDMGRRKELRECVEKLQVLKSPEERQRRLEEIPEIHADPKMDPDCESEDEDEKAEKEKEKSLRPRSSSFNRRGREPISPRRGGYGSNDSWGGARNYGSGNRELSRNLSGRGFSSRGDNSGGSDDRANESLWSSGRDRELQQSVSSEKPRFSSLSDAGARSSRHVGTAELSPRVAQDISPAPPPAAVPDPVPQINESEKMWHYKDPSGKVQGPFSMVQLRKWNNTGYFPAELKIWRTTERPDDSILLTDALAGKFQKQTQTSVYSGRALGQPGQSVGGGWKPEPELGSTVRTAPSTVEIPRKSQDTWGSGTNLPSPTPNRTATPTASRKRSYESRWSPTPVQAPAQSAVQLTGSSVAQSGPSPVSRSDIPMVTSSSVVQQPSLHPLPNTDSANAQMSHLGSAVALPSPTPTGGKQGWGNTQTEKLDSGNNSAQIMSHGHRVDAPSASQSSSPSFNASTTTTSGVFSAQLQSGFPPSDSWRVPVPSQPNTQTTAPPNLPWGMNPMNSNQTAPQTQVPANPSMGWGGHMQAGTNMNWGPSVPMAAHGIPNSGWVAPPGQVQPQAYPNPSWSMSGQAQAQAQGPVNTGSGWMQPGQGPQPGNGNPNWGSHHSQFWGNQQNQNQNGDRLGNQRDEGEAGYGWNRQMSSGGGQNMKGQRVCKFFRENGHCRKGASCDYLHN